MNSIINNSISKSCSYNEYRSLIFTYAQEGKTTGLISSPDYINYTKLNESRMHRLDKTIEVTQETKALLENLSAFSISNKLSLWSIMNVLPSDK